MGIGPALFLEEQLLTEIDLDEFQTCFKQETLKSMGVSY